MNKVSLSNISLTNYDPHAKAIPEEQMGKRTTELKNEIVKLCETYNLSYVQKNKALYVADRELYLSAINKY